MAEIESIRLRIRTSDDAGDEGGSSASAPKAASAGRVPLERGYGRRDSVLAALYRASGFDCRRRHALQMLQICIDYPLS